MSYSASEMNLSMGEDTQEELYSFLTPAEIDRVLMEHVDRLTETDQEQQQDQKMDNRINIIQEVIIRPDHQKPVIEAPIEFEEPLSPVFAASSSTSIKKRKQTSACSGSKLKALLTSDISTFKRTKSTTTLPQKRSVAASSSKPPRSATSKRTLAAKSAPYTKKQKKSIVPREVYCAPSTSANQEVDVIVIPDTTQTPVQPVICNEQLQSQKEWLNDFRNERHKEIMLNTYKLWRSLQKDHAKYSKEIEAIHLNVAAVREEIGKDEDLVKAAQARINSNKEQLACMEMDLQVLQSSSKTCSSQLEHFKMFIS